MDDEGQVDALCHVSDHRRSGPQLQECGRSTFLPGNEDRYRRAIRERWPASTCPNDADKWIHIYIYTHSAEILIQSNPSRGQRKLPTIPNPRGGGGGYLSSSRAGRLGRTLWPQNSTSVAETEKGGQNSTMTPPPPPTLEKGGQYSTSVWKVCKKGGQKSTILKNLGVKILQVWKWGSKFYMLKNRGQNSTMLEKRGVNILHPTPKVEVKILHRLKKGGQKGRAYPLPKI